MELALEWLESQRVVMLDPTKASYFLQYNFSEGRGNGTIYNEGRAEGAQYFWNYLNPTAAAYFVSSVTASLSDPATDGTFTDGEVKCKRAEEIHAEEAGWGGWPALQCLERCCTTDSWAFAHPHVIHRR